MGNILLDNPHSPMSASVSPKQGNNANRQTTIISPKWLPINELSACDPRLVTFPER